MKIRSLFYATLLGACVVASAATPEFPFRDPDLPIEKRIDDLVGRLTLEEKVGVLGFMPGLKRLGVTTTFNAEGIHGVAQGGPSNWGKRNPTATTQFPQAYGLGATWDPELLQRAASEEAYEARYLFQSEKYHRSGIMLMTPNADLARDPRWGRTEESYGEDPFLVGKLAAAYSRGLQGDDPKYLKTGSLLKHFFANSYEDGRMYTSADFDERQLREYYTKSFEIAVREGGARSLMTAYNAVNGIPCHVHPLLRDMVIKEWGLDGIITTDGGGMSALVSDHKAFPGKAEAVAACVKAGVNFFLDRHTEGAMEALKRGLLTEKDIEEAARGRLRMFIRLGLMDPAELVPYSKIGREAGPEPWDKAETKALVREVTRESIVLLKNDKGMLPLDSKAIKSIAVIGPLCNTVLLDYYSGTPPYRVSPREGIEDAASAGMFAPEKFKVRWVAGMSDAAIEQARKSDVAVVCVGNHPESNAGWEIVTSPSEGKEQMDRKDIVLQPDQEAFIRKVCEVNPRTIVVLVCNFPYAMPWAAENAPAIVQITHASQEQGHALADVLFGDYNPGGKTIQTWPKSVDQLPPMADFDLRKGRTYWYSTAEAQYPFGYGLSYTTFKLSNLKSADTLAKDGKISVSVDLANTGSRKGDEVVQLYVRYPQSKVYRPLKQLRGFKRVTVEPGKTQSVEIELKAADLAYWDVAAHAWTVEPGPVELLVGNSSADKDLVLRKTLSVQP